MIILDQLTLILSLVVVASALLTPLMNPFFRKLRQAASPQATPSGVTVLLISDGDATALDEHLPIYLTQDTPIDYQVIVVGEKADAETTNVLKRYSADPKLYSTFIPESARYMSRNKLAITLGVKASKNEWIILSDPRCKPTSDQWLAEMTSHMTGDSHLVLGYTNFSDEAKPFHRFEHLHTALYLLREAQNGDAYRTNCMNLAFRKSDFMSRNGFLEYLKYSVGEYDFLVNKYASTGTVTVATTPASWLTEDPMSDRSWQNRHVYYQEIRKHLTGGSSHRLLYNADQWCLHLHYLLVFSVGILAGLTSRWILLGAAVVALITTLILRTMIGKKALKEFGIEVPIYKIVPYECRILWCRLMTKIRYENADKYDFISHKV